MNDINEMDPVSPPPAFMPRTDAITRDLIDEAESRCKNASLPFEEGKLYDGAPRIRVEMLNGRDTRTQMFTRASSLRSFLSFQFEKWHFVGDYSAACCYEDGVIEAGVRTASLGSMHSIRQLIERHGLTESEGAIVVGREIFGRSVRISLGPQSREASTLHSFVSDTVPTLTISGLSISSHGQALETLEKLANAFFFQIDLNTRVPLILRRASRRGPSSVGPRPSSPALLEFPEHEYDAAPISLYWYARSANGMPLLQFLAYYQVLEFYFNTFAGAEAAKRVKGIIKDPTFRSDRDADIARLVGVLQQNGRGFGGERTQLRAVINGSTDGDSLRAFFAENKDRLEFFTSKQKGLTDKRISLANVEQDIRNDVADLIYDIRCRVVHTKPESADGEIELLLPYSKEASLLHPYVDLIRYLATRVLVASSTPINI